MQKNTSISSMMVFVISCHQSLAKLEQCKFLSLISKETERDVWCAVKVCSLLICRLSIPFLAPCGPYRWSHLGLSHGTQPSQTISLHMLGGYGVGHVAHTCSEPDRMFVLKMYQHNNTNTPVILQEPISCYYPSVPCFQEQDTNEHD